MTRQEWKLYYSKIRADRPKIDINQSTMVAILKELYGYIYNEKQEVFILLVNRYKDKLDKTYFHRIDSWKPEAKTRALDLLKNLVYSKNPFLDLVPKQDDFSDFYLPISYIGDK